MKHRSYRPEREFGLVVGGVFTLLSLWWLHRGKFTGVADVLLPLGAFLVALGLLYPRALVFPNRAWMMLADVLSFVSTRVILAFVFFVVLTPIGLIKRAMGWDPLSRRSPSDDSYWRPYSARQRNHRHYEKMF
jgi:Saxitoxin biosynthesis operon protein SxtJ